MTQAMRRGDAAVIVAVLALVAAACSSSPTSTPGSSIESATASASAAASANASQVPLLKGQVPLAPGRYRIDPSLPMNVTVQVPAGWSGDNWVVVGPRGSGEGNSAPDGMAIRFYAVANLFVHPLSPSDGVLSPAVGPSVDDLVNAMVNHPDWTTTGSTSVTIGGYAGQVVHVTLPVGTSDATPFYLFADATEGQEWGWAAGQLFDIYVIDVGGNRLVIDAFHYPGTPAEDLAAQRAVIGSIQLTP